jgi:hypothetical protein
MEKTGACTEGKIIRIFFLSGLGIYLATALFNIGIIAIDDYISNISAFLPAQRSSYAGMISQAAYRSPIANFVMGTIVKLAFFLGFQHPLSQFHFLMVVLGVTSFLIHFFASGVLFESKYSRERTVYLFLQGFYFLSPLLFTRALIEALAASWVFLSAALACRYFRSQRNADLVFSAFSLWIAFVFRPQTGTCFAGLFLVVALVRSRRQSLLVYFAAVALGFIAMGFIEYLLGGSFHHYSSAYFVENIRNSSNCGVSPWYAYIGLFLLLTFPPFLVRGYHKFHFVSRYRSLWPALAFFITFVTAHSVIPHKEDRFMIPVLSLFFALLSPVVTYSLEKQGAYSTRFRIFYLLNGCLLVLASFQIPQRNVIDVVRFVDRNARITSVWSVGESLGLFPRAFAERQFDFKVVIELQDPGTCETVVAARAAEIKSGSVPGSLERIAEFSPGYLEQIVVWLNPRKNLRRGTIVLFASRGCQEPIRKFPAYPVAT